MARLVSATRTFLGIVCLVIPACAHDGTIDHDPPPGRTWAKHCLIHRPCRDVEPLPRCARDVKPVPLPLPTSAAVGTVEIHSIAGRLRFDEVMDLLRACGETAWQPPGDQGWVEREASCCATLENGTLLIGEDGSELELPNLGCHGDQSRMCCNVALTDQVVVATGLIQLGNGVHQKGWTFQGQVTLCTLPAE